MVSELGRTVALVCPNKLKRQGGVIELRSSDRLIVEA
jgi:hypothetical protein